MTERTFLCAQCENRDNPVTPDNGFREPYLAYGHIAILIFLHTDCVGEWRKQFGIEVSKTK